MSNHPRSVADERTPRAAFETLMRDRLPTALAERFGVTLLRFSPLPVLLVTYGGSAHLPSAVSAYFEEMLNEYSGKATGQGGQLRFRAAELERLDHVLAHGCDVWPTDAPFFVAELDAALEDAGADKIVLGFDPEALRPTFEEVSTAAPPDEIARLKSAYPTYEYSLDGETIWFSRLAIEDPRRTSLYEAAYGRYIPGDPWHALRAMILFVHGRDLSADLAARFDASPHRWE